MAAVQAVPVEVRYQAQALGAGPWRALGIVLLAVAFTVNLLLTRAQQGRSQGRAVHWEATGE